MFSGVPRDTLTPPDPRDGWLAAALPCDARRLRVHDRRLAAALADGGIDVDAGDADAEIGPAVTLSGRAHCAAVPLHAAEPGATSRSVRAAERLLGSASLARLARQAGRRL